MFVVISACASVINRQDSERRLTRLSRVAALHAAPDELGVLGIPSQPGAASACCHFASIEIEIRLQYALSAENSILLPRPTRVN